MSLIEFLALTAAVTGFIATVFGTLAVRTIWLKILLGIVGLIVAAAVVVLSIPAYHGNWLWLPSAWLLAAGLSLSLWFVTMRYRDPVIRAARRDLRPGDLPADPPDDRRRPPRDRY